MKSLSILTVCLAIVCGWYACPRASEWGCKCILCLSNPGGATEFSECKPPIHRLERHLENGGSFPSCSSAKSSGLEVKEGAQFFYTCEQAYGPGWELAIWDDESHRSWVFGNRYCRKLKGYRYEWQGDEGTQRKTKVPIYENRRLRRRSKPFYIQLLWPNGEPAGQKIWYKIK